jgi:hypothetical protein
MGTSCSPGYSDTQSPSPSSSPLLVPVVGLRDLDNPVAGQVGMSEHHAIDVGRPIRAPRLRMWAGEAFESRANEKDERGLKRK